MDTAVDRAKDDKQQSAVTGANGSRTDAMQDEREAEGKTADGTARDAAGAVGESAQDATDSTADVTNNMAPDAVDTVGDAADATDDVTDDTVPDSDSCEGGRSTDDLSLALLELQQTQDRFLRLQAEWDNYRKRTEQERIAERRRAAENLVEKLLPIIDDMERALDHVDTASVESLAEGVQAVLNKLIDILTYEGLEAIDPMGEPFDLNLHQAVGRVEDRSLYEDTVAQVYQKGYSLGGKVLRSAMVVVSHGGSVKPDDDDGQKTTDQNKPEA